MNKVKEVYLPAFLWGCFYATVITLVGDWQPLWWYVFFLAFYTFFKIESR